MKKLLSSSLILFLLSQYALTQNIALDGLFTEQIWEKAIQFNQFKQLVPDIGAAASEATQVYVVNDSSFLYFKVICIDGDPSQLRINLSKRDNLKNDDTFTLEIDGTGNTNSSAFFRCNPLGLQEDGVVNQKEDEDLNPDFIWYSKGVVTESGYQLELAIPFKSLRYKWQPEVVFQIGFRRKIFRKSEVVVFPEYNPELSNRLIQRQHLVCGDIDNQRLLELIPELTYTHHKVKDENQWNTLQNKPSFGLTSKIGLTSDLILDLTYNPDFSQIESDAGKVDINLRNPLYFPEKRPFFQEGLEQFNFGAQLWGTSLRYIVHTRNIIEPLYGVKLTGSLSSKYTIASIFSTDRFAQYPEHYQVMRIRRNLTKDNFIGLTYTGKESKFGFNRVAGLDGIIRLTGKSKLEYNLFASATSDSVGFKNGNNLAANYEWKNRIHAFKTGYYLTDINFNSEIGYVTRPGLDMLVFQYNGNYPVNLSWLRKVAVWINLRPKRDRLSNQPEFWGYTGMELYFNNDSWIWFGKSTANENYAAQKFNTSDWGGGFFLQLNRIIYVEGYSSLGNKIYYDEIEPYQGHGVDADFLLRLTPTKQLIFQLSSIYSSFYKSSNNEFIYDYTIGRVNASVQINRYLLLRTISEYNSFYRELSSQFLLSFIYTPGTAVQIGYNINANKKIPGERKEFLTNLETNSTTFFFKASYLFRK